MTVSTLPLSGFPGMDVDYRSELDRLYASWGILDLLGETVSAMPPEWLRILDIARNLLDGRVLPGVDLPGDLATFVARPQQVHDRQAEQRVRARFLAPTRSDTVVRPLETLADLPQVTASDLAMSQFARDLFDYRLISGEINGHYVRDWMPATEEHELAELDAPPPPPARRKRQKVYALLDVSNSMRDHNRMIFAKALVLAYLIRASEEGAHLYVRTFANSVHPLRRCATPEEFASLARAVLSVAPDGSTDMKAAIEAAVRDIRDIDGLRTYEGLFATAETEILLVSDCESYSVPVLPPVVKLHTVHLGAPRVSKSYQAGLEEIRAVSASFNEIDTAALELPDSTEERWLLFEERATLARVLGSAIDGDDERTRLEHAESLAAVYDRMREAETRRGSRTRGQQQGAPGSGRPGLRALLQALAAAISAILHPHRRTPALAPAPAAPHSGMSFRRKG